MAGIPLGHKRVALTEQVKYLGISFCAGCKLSCDVGSIICNIFGS